MTSADLAVNDGGHVVACSTGYCFDAGNGHEAPSCGPGGAVSPHVTTVTR